ncbi:NOT5_1 [Blepharisma stoltei]|uniref:CCR4-NOT transcription complex subunit 3 n=1 Tax=Blepharisma stoltei TaxID=1481888 RepID=A0AAU9ISF1_9CILI|nr:unnamed protein product [Blepharisma stoltei]
MAKARHLQQEIDKKLKSVEEGVEIFNSTLKKIQSAVNQTQKERYESELKKEIKKLQRVRESLRAYQTNPEIRDKNPITEARKTIEDLMATFKNCERENKTKAFSKTGLSAAPKVDPKEEEREAAREWIRSALQQLQEGATSLEIELDSFKAAKGRRPDASRLEELANQLQTHRFHYGKLEFILRALENDQLPMQKLWDLKDIFEVFIENINDKSYYDSELEQIYAELEIAETPVSPAPVIAEEEPHDAQKKLPQKKVEPKVMPPLVKQDSKTQETPKISVWNSKDALQKIAGDQIDKLQESKEEEPEEVIETETWDYKDTESAKKAIERAFNFQIRPEDRVRSKLEIVKSSYQGHPSYPKRPFFTNPAQYKKLEVDTLFFIFYHQPGTYQQFLASKELKGKEWIYHKRFQTWFQRCGEPKQVSDDREKGTYTYFDFENSWSQKKKADFEFEYANLENELHS